MTKFSYQEVKLYFGLLGYRLSDVELAEYKDGVELEDISQLFSIYDLGHELPNCCKNLSNTLSLFFSVLNNEVLYPSKEEKENALNAAVAIINDLLDSVDVYENKDSSIAFYRTTNLINVIVSGLCEVDDIVRFRNYQKNILFDSLYNKGFDYTSMHEDLILLYFLIAYSKFEDDGKSSEMFDKENKVNYNLLANMILENVNNDTPRNRRDDDSIILLNFSERSTEYNIKKLELKRGEF